MTHVTRMDELPASPVDWVPIPLGAGQEPNAYGGNGSFQYTFEGDDFAFNNVRRNPDETFVFISRVPERW